MIELPLWSPILLALSEASICSALLKCLGLCVWIGFINTSQRINFDSSQQTVGRAWISEDKQNQDTTNCWQGDGNSILECKTRYCRLFIPTKSTKKLSILCKIAQPAENRQPWKTRRWSFVHWSDFLWKRSSVDIIPVWRKKSPEGSWELNGSLAHKV